MSGFISVYIGFGWVLVQSHGFSLFDYYSHLLVCSVSLSPVFCSVHCLLSSYCVGCSVHVFLILTLLSIL